MAEDGKQVAEPSAGRRSGRRTRRPETYRHAVEDRLADDRLDDRVVDPVVEGPPSVAAGHLLPRRAVRMAPAVRQADHPGTHLVGDRDTHLATMDAALEDRHLAVTDLIAGGVVGMNVEHAALATRHQRSEEHTSELQSLAYLVCRLLLEKKKKQTSNRTTHTTSSRHWFRTYHFRSENTDTTSKKTTTSHTS